MVLIFAASTYAGERDILLPAVEAKAGMNVMQAIESRTGARRYDGREVPLKDISTILWAGYGIISENGGKTVHGYDAVSGATSQNRYTIPLAWGRSYIRIYLLLKNGAYEYLPIEHQLNFLTGRNLIENSGSSASGAYGCIIIAADFDKMPGGRKSGTRNVALISSGSVAQNMIVAGSACNVQMLIQSSFKSRDMKTELQLSADIEPLVLLSFGYGK